MVARANQVKVVPVEMKMDEYPSRLHVNLKKDKIPHMMKVGEKMKLMVEAKVTRMVHDKHEECLDCDITSIKSMKEEGHDA